MEYDEFGNPLFEEELSDDDSQVSQSPQRTRLDEQDNQPLRDFDDEEQEQGMQVDGELHISPAISGLEEEDLASRERVVATSRSPRPVTVSWTDGTLSSAFHSKKPT